MPDIRYVCMSDLHFGQDDGLFTNLKPDLSGPEVSKPSHALAALVDGLRELISKNEHDGPRPTLILNGDVLELALTTVNTASMAFERFVELALPSDEEKRLFDRIIYVPGNHDHHVWELARETLYVQYMEGVPAGDDLKEPWHVSRMFVDRGPAPLVGFFLSRLIRRHDHLKDFKVEIAYPNLGIHDEARSRAVLFHHGHFIEDLYKLMSLLADLVFPDDYEMPEKILDYEADNFAWIDFFWSALGRSGRVGPLVQKTYNSMGYDKARDELLGNLATSLSEKLDIPGIPFDKLEAWVLKALMTHIADKAAHHERKRANDGPISDEAEAGLREYLESPVLSQMSHELDRVPDEVTFVFGHTHKPYQKAMSLDGYSSEVPVYNTGGWVVEDPKTPSSLHGASVVFIDEELNHAAINLYRETDYNLEVVRAGGDAVNPFEERLAGLVDGSEAWARFSRVVEKEVETHRKFLRERLDEEVD